MGVYKTDKEVDALFLKMGKYEGEDKLVLSTDLKKRLDKLPKPPLVKTYFPTVDRKIEGFTGGELIAVSGPRKSGKTLVCQTLTKNFKDQGHKSLWLSYELMPGEFLNRYNAEVPEFYIPEKMEMFSIDWVWEKVFEAITKYQVSVVFIDHLHYLFDMTSIRNASIEIGSIIRSLKFLSIQTKTIIFILCHTKKLERSKEPDDDDMRDSSFVAQESDVGWMIWRDATSDNRSFLKICYSRRTGCAPAKVPLIKSFETGMLREEAIGYEEPYVR